jgi:gluconate 5-dehydrogenase
MMGAPNFDLSGRVALITGAARGIGLGIAQALASAGCAVAIQDLDLEEATARAREITAAGGGGRAIPLGGDLTDPSLAEPLVRETVDRLGGLHVLVNNGAVQSRQHWTQLSLDEFDRTFRANVATPMRLCQQAEPILRKQRWGRILNVGSIQQILGNENMLAYAMSKSALESMTKALARDLARDGVTVNLLAPGYFDTIRNVDALGDPQKRAAAGRRIAAGRVGEPQDCGGAALMLCSPAAEYITGQTLFVDGGLSVQWW